MCRVGRRATAGFGLLTVVPEVPLVNERGRTQLGEQVGAHLLATSWRRGGGCFGGGDCGEVFGLKTRSKGHCLSWFVWCDKKRKAM